MKTTANIATYPARFPTLLKMLKSIEGQFDEVRIYLNEYKKIPDELKSYTCKLGENLTDNGKFWWADKVGHEYYFTLDDDIIYPSDYVDKTIPRIKDRVVSYHGRKLKGVGLSYYRGHGCYHCTAELKEEQEIDVGGSGVMAFDTRYFRPQVHRWIERCMSDLLVSAEAAQQGLSVVCLPRDRHWITLAPQVTDTIYDRFKKDEKPQNFLADFIFSLRNYIRK